MIIVTGAAGFIGSRLIRRLNEDNLLNIIAVDRFGDNEKEQNLNGSEFREAVDRDLFIPWLDKNYSQIEFIFHLGARTDTAEFDFVLLDKMNTQYSKDIWARCVKYRIPLIYASSAATYGLGESGYEDDESKLHLLKPLNPYGHSKHSFDLWVLQQNEKPVFWSGLKFFNVYGPNEYHKGRMASVVWHAFNQISTTGTVKLFRSYNPLYIDGEQLRDFIYVKDVVEVCLFQMHHRKDSGIYNLGTGRARTFLDLAKSVFNAMNIKEKIEFVDVPADIRNRYQYFTEADMKKLRISGYTKPFFSLEEGVSDYIENYLQRTII